MADSLWLPPGTQRPAAPTPPGPKPGDPVDRLTIPDGDVTLADGRVLKRRHSDVITSKNYSDEVVTWTKVYYVCPADGLGVIASVDPTGVHGDLLHVSVSYTKRLPDWETVKTVKETFFGDAIDAMMVLPKASDYVNVHRFTFHIVQTPVHWGIR